MVRNKYYVVSLACLVFSLFANILPLNAAAGLNVTNTEIPGAIVYPSQSNFEVFDFTIAPSSADVLNALTVINFGSDFFIDLSSVTLYQDNGDGIFQGWQRDTDLGKAVYYSPLNTWYWQNLNVSIPASGQRFFVAVETVRDASIATDRRTLQFGIPAYYDLNSDGLFDFTKDTGVFMASKNNGPVSSVTNFAAATLWKRTFDALGPVTLINSPAKNQTLSSRQVSFSGVDKDQGGGSVSAVNISIQNNQNVYLVQNGQADLTDGQWSYNYTFTADGTYTITSQGIDNNANLETQGDSVTFTISTTVVPPPPPPPAKNYASGDLIKASGAAVYYFGADGKRYVFPNLNTFNTWYSDFSAVKTITDSELASITIGGNVTFRPGVKLVKITTDPKVYAVDSHGTLRWISTAAIASALYGANWQSKVADVPDAFFINYKMGTAIENVGDFTPVSVTAGASSINADKGL